MVSASNLNFDCLELIFIYLAGNDLVSISLVSRSFLAGVIPRLYRSLIFGPKQAKRYPTINSPFATVLANPDLARHVRRIDLRVIPIVKFRPQTQFMDDCARTIALCNSLSSFTCTLDVMPRFLTALQHKNSLEHLRFRPNFTMYEAKQLSTVLGLRSLTLDSGSWTVVDVLPKWSEGLKPTLTSLTMTSMQTLSRDILEVVFPNLPLLTSLHVINCSKIDQNVVLELLVHVPQLQSLAFTCYDLDCSVPDTISPLPALRHLSVDTYCRASPIEHTPKFCKDMLMFMRSWACPLKSFSLKLSEKIALSESFIKDLVKTHRKTLVHLSLRNCGLAHDSTKLIFSKCNLLETAKLTVPTKEIAWFAEALSRAEHLHTITDVGDMRTGAGHVQRASIQKMEIRTLMSAQPRLENIIADGRTWTAVRSPAKKDFELIVKKHGPTLRHWFMPPPGVVQS
ncbi:hypothetical protein C8Q74DRAFT_1280534 [Fomes fomentarius]|nr:hypothetical protein C8Q74DRAFT_1280534 [Fomes fomentarius]